MSDATAQVSIVIVVYNGATTLRACLDSVLAHAGDVAELVVVDGGSTDGTVEILREYEPQLGAWVSETDAGVYDAMNKGAHMSRGGWLLFLGADDCILEDFAAAAATLSDLNTIYYGDVWMPRRGLRYDGVFSSLKLARRNLCHQSIFYPRSLWDELAYDTRYPVMADYAFNLRCFGEKNVSWHYLPLCVAQFNDESGISQTRVDHQFESDRLTLMRDNLPAYASAFAVFWHGGARLLKALRIYDTAWKAKLLLTKKLGSGSHRK